MLLRVLPLFAMLILWSLLASNHVYAWETLVNENEGKGDSSWKSIYQQQDVNQVATKYRGKAKKPHEEYAEHTRIADMALRRLGVYDVFGRKGSARIKVVDLNASLFRFDDLGDLTTEGDDPDTEIEERLIVPPAYFAGIPDYSYTIYDWLNKNQLCAAGESPELQKKCHTFFMGWHGNLNSTHFASQAEKMYKNYHLIALYYARKAERLHKNILRNGGKDSEKYYTDFIKETEHLALGYEGFAQHFLQDRWAIGHMWERWGSGEFTALPNKGNAINTLIGMISGLIHGSEAVFNKEHNLSDLLVNATKNTPLPAGYFVDRDAVKLDPSKYLNVADPMSSPLIIDKHTVKVMQWKHATSSSGKLINGVGDERLTDMIDGQFGAAYRPFYTDIPIDVKQQKEELLSCSTAGWAEVIRTFGQFDGGYGIYKVKLQNDPKFDILKRRKCWDMWATNRSIYTGIVKDKALNYSVLGRLAFGRPQGVSEHLLNSFLHSKGLGLFNKELIKLVYTVEAEAMDDPDGISLAVGGIGPLFNTETGNHYAIPDYVEPSLLSELPAESKTGKDKQTLFGAFSRANSGYWCENFKQVFNKYDLRGSKDKRKQEICEYLADFVYDRTQDFYDGVQKEQRKVGDKVVPSICTIRNKNTERWDELLPRYLDQGYVPYGDNGKPQEKTDKGIYKSIVNWCRAVPIINLPYADTERAKNQRDNNVVAEIHQGDSHLILEGSNFGDQQGKVYYWEEGQPASSKKAFGYINSWQEWSIDIDTSYDKGLEASKTYLLAVETAPDKQGDTKSSVGLFKLRILEPETREIASKPVTGVGPCGDQFKVTAELPDLNQIRKDSNGVNVQFFEQVKQAYQPYKRAALAEISRNIACVDKLRSQVKAKVAGFPSNVRYDPEIVKRELYDTESFYGGFMEDLDFYRRFAEAIERDIEDKIYMLKDKDWLYYFDDYASHMPCSTHIYDTIDSSTLPPDIKAAVGEFIAKEKQAKHGVFEYMKNNDDPEMGMKEFWHEMYGVAHHHRKQSWDYINKITKSTQLAKKKGFDDVDHLINNAQYKAMAKRNGISEDQLKQLAETAKLAKKMHPELYFTPGYKARWQRSLEGMFHFMADAFEDLDLLFKQVAVKRMIAGKAGSDIIFHEIDVAIQMALEEPDGWVNFSPYSSFTSWGGFKLSTDIHAVLPYHKSVDIVHNHPYGYDYESGASFGINTKPPNLPQPLLQAVMPQPAILAPPVH